MYIQWWPITLEKWERIECLKTGWRCKCEGLVKFVAVRMVQVWIREAHTPLVHGDPEFKGEFAGQCRCRMWSLETLPSPWRQPREQRDSPALTGCCQHKANQPAWLYNRLLPSQVVEEKKFFFFRALLPSLACRGVYVSRKRNRLFSAPFSLTASFGLPLLCPSLIFLGPSSDPWHQLPSSQLILLFGVYSCLLLSPACCLAYLAVWRDTGNSIPPLAVRFLMRSFVDIGVWLGWEGDPELIFSMWCRTWSPDGQCDSAVRGRCRASDWLECKAHAMDASIYASL